MTDIDPTRLGAGPAPVGSLGHALGSARRHGPSPDELQRVAASLPLSPVPPVAALTTTSLALKIGAGFAIVAVAVVGFRAFEGTPRATLAGASAAASAVVAEAKAIDAVAPREDSPLASSEVEPRAPDGDPLASASALVPDNPPPAVARPDGVRTASSASEGPSEAALLLSARSALASDPERALALTQEHKRRFPTGKLAQEREVIAIAALQKLGRSGAAKAESDRFKQEHPGSIHQQGSSSPNGH